MPRSAATSVDDLGFTFKITKQSLVLIDHHGKRAAQLKGQKATKFATDVQSKTFAEQQQLMARLTGNYKHGNERVAKNRRTNP